MKNLRCILVLFLAFPHWFLSGQTDNCDCIRDIEFLHEQVKKTPAYKIDKNNYMQNFEEIIHSGTTLRTPYNCFENLNLLLASVADSHWAVLGSKADTSKNIFPRFESSLDSLRAMLVKKTYDSIEGIYRNKTGFVLGITFNKDLGRYQAVILESNNDKWQNGDIIYQYIALGNNYLYGYGGQYSTGRYISYKERISKGVMLTLGLQKRADDQLFINAPSPDELFMYDSISQEIDYIKVGSFSSFYPTLSDAETFYAGLKAKLEKKYLILDLRDNTGGGDRNSNILYKLLKKYLKHNKIIILANHKTMSNAEQFILKLKKHRNVYLLGDRTSGTLAYEIKNSIFTLPCSNFTTVLTSKLHRKFLPYELKGITPDYSLDYYKNWIEQAMDFIYTKRP